MKIENGSRLPWTERVIEADKQGGGTNPVLVDLARRGQGLTQGSGTANDAPAPRQSFTSFGKLPNELRLHVWRHAGLGGTTTARRTSPLDKALLENDPEIRKATQIELKHFVDAFSAKPFDLIEHRGPRAVLSALRAADPTQIDGLVERFHGALTNPADPARTTIGSQTASRGAALLLASGRLSAAQTSSLALAIDGFKTRHMYFDPAYRDARWQADRTQAMSDALNTLARAEAQADAFEPLLALLSVPQDGSASRYDTIPMLSGLRDSLPASVREALGERLWSFQATEGVGLPVTPAGATSATGVPLPERTLSERQDVSWSAALLHISNGR